MNIEEERKAFEEICQDDHGLVSNPWDVWLAAKAHAQEMAKPVAKINPRRSLYEIVIGGHCIHIAFDKEEAVSFAESFGYRVEVTNGKE